LEGNPVHLNDVPFNETVQTSRQLPRKTVWQFRLFYGRPPKGLSMNDRAHWRTRAASTNEVRQMVFARVRNLHVPALERIRVDSAWFVRDRRPRDTDNPFPFLKAVYDGIGSNRGISARIVEDDSPEYMDKTALQIIYEQGVTPHFLFTITDLGSAL